MAMAIPLATATAHLAVERALDYLHDTALSHDFSFDAFGAAGSSTQTSTTSSSIMVIGSSIVGARSRSMVVGNSIWKKKMKNYENL